jgi:hypothetical protein
VASAKRCGCSWLAVGSKDSRRYLHISRITFILESWVFRVFHAVHLVTVIVSLGFHSIHLLLITVAVLSFYTVLISQYGSTEMYFYRTE